MLSVTKSKCYFSRETQPNQTKPSQHYIINDMNIEHIHISSMDEEKTYYFLAMKEHCNIFGNCNATPYREMNDKYNFISFILWACNLHDEKMVQNSHNHIPNMHVLLRTISVMRMIWCKYFGWSTLFFSVTHQDTIVWCHYYHSIGLVFGVLTFVVRFDLIRLRFMTSSVGCGGDFHLIIVSITNIIAAAVAAATSACECY